MFASVSNSLWFFFFFFSSRRRHTISTRDWSSDVCSSDLRRMAMYREWLDAGFRAAGGRAAKAGFDIMPSTSVVVGDDVNACRTRVKSNVALYVGGMGARGKNFYNELARRYGYEDAATTIQDLYLAGKKAEAEAAVPDALVDEVALCGPRERSRERLAEWKGAGMTTLMLRRELPAVRTV